LAVSEGPQRTGNRCAFARLTRLAAAAVAALGLDCLEEWAGDMASCGQRTWIQTARVTAFGFTGWVMNNQLR
jgi:hypothetical protein